MTVIIRLLLTLTHPRLAYHPSLPESNFQTWRNTLFELKYIVVCVCLNLHAVKNIFWLNSLNLVSYKLITFPQWIDPDLTGDAASLWSYIMWKHVRTIELFFSSIWAILQAPVDLATQDSHCTSWVAILGAEFSLYKKGPFSRVSPFQHLPHLKPPRETNYGLICIFQPLCAKYLHILFCKYLVTFQGSVM